jgi:hypothetical protein
MPNLELSVRTCESCIQKNNGVPSQTPCQKAMKMPAPGLIVVADSLVGADCPCRASWDDLKRAANRLPSTIGLSEWAARLLPLVKQARAPIDAGYVPAGSSNNAHTFVTKDRKLLVWVQQIPDAQQAERFRQWFAANGLLTPVARMSTAQKLTASAWMALEEMPAEGAKVVRELIASIPFLVAVLAAIALSPAKYVRFFQCLFYGAGIVTQLKDYFESFGGWLAYAVNATSTSQLREGAKHLARFASMAVRDLGLAGIERMVAYLRARQGDGAAIKSDADKGGFSGDASAQPKPGSLKEMPASIKARDPNSGSIPFSDFPEFRNRSLSKDLYPWLQARFTKIKSAKLDADGYISAEGGSEIWARRIPGTNLVECVRIDLVSMKGASRGHNPRFKDGPVLQTGPRANARFEGNDPAGHYGRMIQGEGPAPGTTLTTEQVAYGKVGHFHKETIRVDQLEEYCRAYVPSAQGVADWGSAVPAKGGPQTTAGGGKVFKGEGARNNAVHIPLLP